MNLGPLGLTTILGVALAVGYGAGVMRSSLPSPGSPSPLQLRTEAFEPDCTSLHAAASEPRLVRNGQDWVLVLVHQDRFTVLGIALAGGPETAWWSASLPHALAQACGPGGGQ
jgi:hypothetical protein